ncbi:MAG TPA: hypothetical protein VND91_06305, partial [Candidatus Saccharimonadia bacterium]|nr:hypothetical protein [Candidatus Saccharimonadia bacterium]
MKRALLHGKSYAGFVACLFAAGFATSAMAQHETKVPADVEAVLSKALTPTQTQTLGPTRLPSGSVTGDFGYSLAVSDKYAVIGSPADTVAGGGASQNGSVYIFERVNSATTPWKLLDRLTPQTTAPERFGQAVAVSGDLVVIGAPGLKGNTVNGGVGRAFVYVRDPAARTTPFFMRRDTLAGSDPPNTVDDIANNGAAFGESVGAVVQKFYNFLNGTTTTTTHVFVGAPQADTRDPDDGTVRRTGAVLVYRCTVGKALPPNPPTYVCSTGGTSGKILVPDLHVAGADFGQSLSVVPPKPTSFFVTPSTITLAVGSPDQCSNCLVFPPQAAVFGGAAYVFYGSGPNWGRPTYIRPGSGIATGDDFGDALAFNGTQLAIGAPRDNALNGTVRIFQKSEFSPSPCGGFTSGTPQSACAWSSVQTLGPGASGGMLFGQRVAFYGNQLLVGAPNRQVVLNTLQGSVFYFDRATPTAPLAFQFELSRTGVTGDTNFGSAVAVLGGSLLVGEKNGPNGGTSPPGRVYTYTLTKPVSRTPNPAPTTAPTGDRFGTITVLRDGVMLVGVPGASSGGLANVGLVRVYVPNPAAPGTHMLLQTITPPPGESIANLRFGHALALTASGNRILIGAPGADAVPGDGSVVPVGAVFVYGRGAFATSWTLATDGENKLLHPTPQAASDFGASLDVDPAGAVLVVGAPNA